MTRRFSKGFTLIEVLIAVGLVGLLMFGMSMALRIALNVQARSEARLVDNRRMMGAQRAMNQELSNFMPVSAIWMPPSGGGFRKVPFFGGDQNSMRFVSSYSLNEAHRGVPQILEFLVISGDKGVRLIVNELSYHGPFSAGDRIMGFEADPGSGFPRTVFAPITPGPSSFVLADRLSYCRIYYQQQSNRPPYRRWREDWPIAEWPLAIRVDMAALETDGARLHPVSITSFVHANPGPDLAKLDEPLY